MRASSSRVPNALDNGRGEDVRRFVDDVSAWTLRPWWARRSEPGSKTRRPAAQPRSRQASPLATPEFGDQPWFLMLANRSSSRRAGHPAARFEDLVDNGKRERVARSRPATAWLDDGGGARPTTGSGASALLTLAAADGVGQLFDAELDAGSVVQALRSRRATRVGDGG